MQKEKTNSKTRIIEIPLPVIALFIVLICAANFFAQKTEVMSLWNNQETSLASEDVTSYRVTFDIGNGTWIEGSSYENGYVEVVSGDIVTEPVEDVDFEYEGYSVDGWYTDSNYTTEWDFTNNTVTEDIILYAKWSRKTFTVSFYNQYSNDGTLSELLYTMTVNYGSTLLTGEREDGVEYFEYEGETPTRSRHAFTTWLSLTGSYVITEDTDFVAIYSEDTIYLVNISYLSDNGNILQENKILVYEENDTFLIEIPEFEGYTSVMTKKTGITEITGNVSLDDFKELKDSISSYYGDYMTITQDDEYSLYTIELELEYTASESKYVVNHYLQNLDQNGYTLYESEIISDDVYVGDVVSATENTYEGFTLNTSISTFTTTVTVYKTDETLASIDIYYDRNNYYIYLDSAGGTYFDPIAVLYGTDITSITDGYTPTKDGYEFATWTTETNYDTMPAEDLYYTATYNIGTTSYTIFYWIENADDDNFTNEGSYLVDNVITESTVDITSTDFETIMATGFENLVGADYVDYYYYDESTTLYYLNSGTSSLGNTNDITSTVEINNTGTTVINVYYMRNVYTLRFMVGRTSGRNYQVATATGGSESAATWTTVSTHAYLTKDGTTYYDDDYTISAKYGADISAAWPTVSDVIASAGSYYFISWGTSSSSSYYTSHSNKNILGVYGYMSEELIIDKTDTSVEHVLIGYWSSSVRYFEYHYMFETLDQTEATDYTYNGKYYEEDSTSIVRSTNTAANLTGPAMGNMTYVGSTYSSSGYGGSTESAAVDIYFYYNLDEYTLTFYNLNQSIILDFTDDEIAELQKSGIYVEDDEITMKYGADISAIAALRDNWTDYTNLVYPNELIGTKEYTFGGWYLDQEYTTAFDWTDTSYTTATNNLIIYAYWIAPTYDVTFNVNDGTWEESSLDYIESNGNYIITVDEGTVLVEPAEPTREGYTFEGWYYNTTLNGNEVELKYLFSESQYIYGELELTAKWSVDTNVEYTVNYVLAQYDEEGNLKTDISQYDTVVYLSSAKEAVGTYGTTITEKALTDITYNDIFYYLPDAAEKELTLSYATENTIYFFYTLKEEVNYTVYYVEYTGITYERGEIPESDLILSTKESSITTTDETSVTETAISISGYTVTDYYKTSLQLVADESLNTMYFYYTENSSTVEYYINYYIAGNDGTYSDAPTVTTSGMAAAGSIILSSNWESFTTVDSSYFVGHELDTEYSDVYMIVSSSNNILNLYFKCATYTITYDLQGGTFSEEVDGIEEQEDGTYLSEVTYPNTVTKPGTITKENSNFVGWFVKNDDGTYTEFTYDEIVTEDTTLYAIWIDTKDLTITKIWDDDDNRDGLRPETIDITVLQDDNELETLNVEVTQENTIYTTITVEKYYYVYTDENKTTIAVDENTLELQTEEYEYLIQEEIPSGYTASYDQTTYTVTNTHEPELVDKTVTKYWQDNGGIDGFRSSSVQMELYANGIAVEDSLVTLTEDGEENINSNTWVYTWENLYKYENGEEITYTVLEYGCPTEYSTKYVQSTLSVYNAYPPESELIVEVVWDDGDNRDGLRVGDLQVLLQANGEDYDGLSEEEATVTLNDANDWTYEYGGLEKYNLAGDTYEYTAKLLEDSNYTTLISNGYTITISIEEDEDEITKVITRYMIITATYSPETMSRTITKVWDDNDDQDGIRPEEITVTLKSNDEDTYYTTTLNDDNNWSDTIDGIYIYYNGGEKLEYYIEEEDVADGYTSTYTQDEYDNYIITNTHTPETISKTVKKTWNDSNNAYSTRSGSITVVLYADGVEYDTQTLDSTNNWQYEWEELDKYSDGVEIEYEVEEASIPDNYEVTYSEDTFEITNSLKEYSYTIKYYYDGEPDESLTETGTASYQKIISEYTDNCRTGYKLDYTSNYPMTITDDEDSNVMKIYYVIDEDATKDLSYTIYYYLDGSLYETQVNTVTVQVLQPDTIEVGESILNVTDKYEGYYLDRVTYQGEVVTEFPVEVEDGEIIRVYYTKRTDLTYTVYHLNKDTGEELKKDTVSNVTYLTVVNSASLATTFDNYVYDSCTPETLTVGVDETENVIYLYYSELVDITVTKTWVDNNNSYNTRQNVVVTLYAEGVATDEQLTLSESNDWTDTFTGILKYDDDSNVINYTVAEAEVEGYTNEIVSTSSGYEIINTIAQEYTEVSGTKTWVAGDDADSLTATINLYRDGVYLESTTVTGNNSYTFDNLEVYDLTEEKDGHKYTYTVEEVAMDEFETTTDSTGLNFTNTRVGTRTITVTKEWEDDDDALGIRPESIEVTLNSSEEEGISTITLSDDNDWTYYWEDLDKYNSSGALIEYNVEEEELTGNLAVVYSTDTSSEEVEDGTINYTITNTYEEPTETKSIEINKVWDDNENQDGIRADEITIYLTCDDEDIYYISTLSTENATTENEWTITIDGVRVYYADGNEIEYSIEEDEIDGYEASYKQNEDGSYTITNTHTPETISKTVTKTWVDEENTYSTRNESVEVVLYADGDSLDTQTLSSSSNWEYEWEELDKYSDGVEIEYTVEEQDVPSYYEVTYSEDTFEITNTLKEYSYTIEYYYEEKIDDELTETGTALYNEEISEYTDNCKTGYRLSYTENYPLTISADEDSNVMRIYYVIDDGTTKILSYTVNYYKDDELVSGDTQTVTETVQILEADTMEVDSSEINTVDKYEGYVLDCILLNGEEVDEIPETVTSGDVISVKYVKRTNLSYTVNYLEEVTDTVLSEAKIVTDQTYLDEVKEEAIEIYGYDMVDPTEVTITIDVEDNVINFYYTKRTDLSYTVNYLEQDSNEILATSKTVSNQTYLSEVTENAIKIDGYDMVDPTEATITIDVTGNEINFYYTKRTDLTYTVNYLEQGTNEVLATSKTEYNQTYLSSVTEAPITIDGYDKVSTENVTIEIGVGENVINFYYTKRTDLSYTVYYLEKDTNEPVSEAKTVTDQTYLDEVTEEAIDIDGYYKVDPTEVTITINVTGNEITFYYTKRTDLKYTVEYYYEGTIDSTKTESYTATYLDVITTYEDKNITGYRFEKTENLPLTVGVEASSNVIKVYYIIDDGNTKTLSYTVNYYQDDELVVADTQTVTETVQILQADTMEVDSDQINTVDKYIGYELDCILLNDEEVDEIPETVTSGDVISVKYVKRTDLSYTVNYLEQGTNEKLADSKVVEDQTYLAQVTEAPITIDGYDKVSTENVTIEIGVGENVINFYYTKRTDLSYTVNYLEQGTNTILSDAKTVENQTYLSEVTENAINISGYDKVEPTESTITIDVTGNEITFYYTKRTDLTYTVEYYYEGTIDSTKTESYTATYLDVITTYEDKNITGYRFEKTENLPLTVGVETSSNVIKVYYIIDDGNTKTLSYTVNYYQDDELTVADTQTVSETVQILQPDTMEVDTTQINTVGKYEGYVLDCILLNDEEVDEIPETVTSGDVISVKYVKRTDLSYTVNYLEEGTNEELADSKVVEDQTYLAEVTEAPITIDGYDKVSTENVTIEIGVGENVINFYYTKRTDLSYTVYYLEKDTNEPVSEAKTVTDQTYLDEITEEAIDIDGYYKVDPTEVTITINVTGNEITFYYTKRTDLTYTVEYYYEGTINESKTETYTATYLDVITEYEDKNITGYRFEKTENLPLTVGVEASSNVIKVYYIIDDGNTKTLSYTVDYYKDDEKVIADTQTVSNTVQILQPDTMEVDTTQINTVGKYEGYVLDCILLNDEEVSEIPETVTSGDIISVKYVKRTDLSYTVNYLEQGTNKELADSKVVEDQTYLSEVTENAIDISGYDKVDPTEETITIDVTGNEITFYYTKRTDLSYTVNYLEEGTNTPLSQAKTVDNQTYLSEVTENAIEISGYDMVDPTTVTITIDVTGNVINFYYTKRTNLSYIVNYYDKDTNELLKTKEVENVTYLSTIYSENEVIDIDTYKYDSSDVESIVIGTDENIINLYYSKLINVTVTKTWVDNNNSYNTRQNVVVTLFANGTITDKQLTLSTDNSWTATFTDLLKYEDGKIVNYTVTENDIEGYTNEIVSTSSGYEIINTIAQEYTEVSGTKTWVAGNDASSLTATMNLYRDGVYLKSTSVTGNSSYSFENLEVYDLTDGHKYSYTVQETPINEFVITTDSTGLNFTNTRVGTRTITVTKVWDDNDDVLGIRPDTIEVTLNSTEQSNISTITLSEENNWTHSWEELDKYNSNGALIEYSVEEEELTGNLAVVYSSSKSYTEAENNVINWTITNTYTKPTQTKSVTVNKVWDDNEDEALKRPDSINITLYKQSGISDTELVQTYTLDVLNETSHVFSNLLVYDEYGYTINYTAQETEVNTDDLKFYATAYSYSGNTITITNTFQVTQEYVTIDVNKVWNDNEIQALRRPNSIKVKLMYGSTQIDEAILNETNNWAYTFGENSNIAKYDSYGDEIEYTIYEEEVEIDDLKFYTSTIGNVNKDTAHEYSATITNTFKTPSDTKGIVVTKVWDDGNDTNRTKQVRLVLTGDNGGVYSSVLTEANADTDQSSYWTDTITVPVYNTNGQEIEYTLSEEEVNSGDLNRYLQTIEGYTATNTAIIKQSSVSETGTNTITSLDDTVEYEITYNLQVDTEYVGTIDITIVDTLEYTIEDYDLDGGTYDENTNTVTWRGTYNTETGVITWYNADGTITEEKIDGTNINISKDITVKYSDMEVAGTVVTNNVEVTALLDTGAIYTNETSYNTVKDFTTKVTIDKLWEGDTTSSRPSTIVVRLTAEVEENTDYTISSTTDVLLSANNDWVYTWQNLPKYDEQTRNTISYSVMEVSTLEDYYISSTSRIATDELTEVTITNSKYGVITITKVDEDDNSIKLGGAELKIERLNDDGTVDTSFTPIYKTTSSDSEDLGTLVFDGLEYGTYRITEVTAPDGYEKTKDIVAQITISADNNDVSITVTNKVKTSIVEKVVDNVTEKVILPITGGDGTEMTVFAGLIIIALGCMTIGIGQIKKRD